ncbi:reductase [Shewanella sp. Choline-02u-19]|jgi:nitrate reductase NapD|uniref:chaperone NapD n=1 Tax=unclassified Shewanella TaxID=196818 RepID=UPI000C31F33B|nr:MULTISPECIES: chaperone NapD [unclassified Shewanella]PKG58877.1 reductase [Shewanella sp. GutDb-MelDb]PKG73859.1 reductase [Shewanella sp. GutCb]PKH56891.1 reductase [Shewanella sp. Bg11-22]PKI27688.1 reductase [Shewanella sp. Choline-02u-19]
MSLPEVHISSLLVQVSPEHLNTTKKLIEDFEEAEIYGVNDVGKIVVVLETQKEGFISDIIEKINNMPGVLGATMVYHQIDSDPDSTNLPPYNKECVSEEQV